jgi:hypothetical protein
MANTSNPLQGFYRAPKLYTQLPSQGKFYSDDIIDWPESGELPIFPMTSKDEMIMKNPDALLNGEAVAQVIASCVPAVKKPRELVANDVDTLLIAVQGATNGDEIDVTGTCPKCKEEVTSVASIEAALESMATLEKTYTFNTEQGLSIEIRPFNYDSSVKAGIANFKTTRSLQTIQGITDEMEQLKAFNNNFVQIAALNFDLMVDSVASISGVDAEGDEFVVTDKTSIREFLENCDAVIGRGVEENIAEVNKIGVEKKMLLECDSCEEQFEQEINFDPVNFFTAS